MRRKEGLDLEGDLVLVYYEGQPVVYARVEAIEPDVKKDWFQVSLIILTIPLQPVTWILREEYIRGDVFTMGGKAMKIEKVQAVVPRLTPGEGRSIGRSKHPDKDSKVLAFKKQH